MNRAPSPIFLETRQQALLDLGEAMQPSMPIGKWERHGALLRDRDLVDLFALICRDGLFAALRHHAEDPARWALADEPGLAGRTASAAILPTSGFRAA